MQDKNKINPLVYIPAFILIGVIIFMVYRLAVNYQEAAPTNRIENPVNSAALSDPYQPEDENTTIKQDFPPHGTIIINPDLECLATFTITTPSNNPFMYFYILLVREEDGEKIIAYLNAGQEFVLPIPLGNYQFYYASGTGWYGDDELFGRNTSVFKSDDIFSFYDEEYNTITNWFVVLRANLSHQGDRLEGDFVHRNEILDLFRDSD